MNAADKTAYSEEKKFKLYWKNTVGKNTLNALSRPLYIGVGALQTNVVPKNEITMEVGN